MSKVRTLTRYLLLSTVGAGIVGCDHASKHVATETLAGAPTRSYFFDVVRLSYAENPGSFLSLGADLPGSVRFALFTFGVGILLAFLLLYSIRARWSGLSLLGFVMFIAGGASNWVDRLVDGRVVDFLNIGLGQVRTGIFNIADMAILAGIAIVLFGEYSRGRKQRHG